MPPAITFPVHDVAPGTECFAADEATLQAAISSAGAGPILVKSWDSRAPLFGASKLPALAAAAKLAYDTHLPLVLSPDAVWITITQGFAHHVRLHAEELRRDLVQHEGKERLEVRTGFIAWDADLWRDIIDTFAEQIGERSGDVGRLLVCDFSTTATVERTVSQVVLMDAMASYFEYVVLVICGIPSITLEGSPEDWRRLRDKVERLGRYGLALWTDHLLPICEQFVRASDGDVDRDFWRRMVGTHHSCGGEYLDGWIGKLFPYLKDATGAVCRWNPSLPTPEDKAEWRELLGDELDENSMEAGGVAMNDLPGGLSTVPVVIEYLGGGTQRVRLCAGLIGLAQDEATLAIRPMAGWALCTESPFETLRERMKAASEAFHPPPAGQALARKLEELCWENHAAVFEMAQGEFAALYSVTNGASLPAGGGVSSYRILPLEQVSEFEMASPSGLAEWWSIVQRLQAEGRLDGETPEMAMERLSSDSPRYRWLRFCDLPDGSFLAVRIEDGRTGEVAHVTAATLAGQDWGTTVAASLFECIERMVAGNLTLSR